MNRDQALAKIRKCLALSESANPHEAAAALRQAQALMREHRVDDDELRHVDVSERPARARSAAMNRWEVSLAHLVADAFGCQHFSKVFYLPQGLSADTRRRRDVVFVGVGAAPEVAAYAYQVLLRQCVGARRLHIIKQPASCKPATKTARGDRFAEGWVLGVRGLVQAFAGQPGDQLLIEGYLKARHPDLQAAKSVSKAVGRNVRDTDLVAGFLAGEAAKLERGLGANAAPLQLGAEG